jgi:hypothetical protein
MPYGKGMGVKVFVPGGLTNLDAQIEEACGAGGRRAFVKQAAEQVRAQAVRNLGASAHIGPSLRTRVTGLSSAEIYSRHPGAKAQDVGAYIVPKAGRVLRFVVRGAVIYTSKPVRIKGKRYLQDALRPGQKLPALERAAEIAFDQLGLDGFKGGRAGRVFDSASAGGPSLVGDLTGAAVRAAAQQAQQSGATA